MSRRRLVTLSAVGLGVAVLSNVSFAAAYLGDGGYLFLNSDSLSWLNGWLLVSLVATFVLGPASGVIAALIMLGASRTRRGVRWGILALVGAAALGAWYEIGAAAIDSAVHLDEAYVGTGPIDWKVVGIAAVPLLLYFVAAMLYVFAANAHGVPAATRADLLILLLLASVPVLNLFGFAGFVAWTVNSPAATPARPAVSA